jgi:putative phosphoesterase
MRIALISDIHGNEVALRAVRAAIERAGVDQIVCLGDVATLGPRPEAVLHLLREMACPCITGNHDAFLLEPQLLHTYSEAPFIHAAVDWCRSRLSPADLDFVRTFQKSAAFPLDGGAELFVFHGSPRSHMEDLLATTPPERLDELLDGHGAAVMAGGHTHVQMVRQHRGLLLVNPGSVGLPFREHVGGGPPTVMAGHAEYAVVESRGGELAVTLHRVPVDRAALRRAVEGSDNPMAGMLLQQYG